MTKLEIFLKVQQQNWFLCVKIFQALRKSGSDLVDTLELEIRRLNLYCCCAFLVQIASSCDIERDV